METTENITPAGNTPAEPMPKTHLTKAILVTILCCTPLGIPAIGYATAVQNLWLQGRKDDALDCQRKANRWANWSLGVGIALTVLFIVVYAIAIAAMVELADELYW